MNNSTAEKAAKIKAFFYNTFMTSLDLGGNNISDEGAKAIAEPLTNNPTLTSIDLDGNHIGREVSEDLATIINTLSIFANSNKDSSEPLPQENSSSTPMERPGK